MHVVGLFVVGVGDAAGLDALEVLDEQFVVRLDVLGSLAAADGAGHVVPPVGGVLVVDCQCALEELILLLGPCGGARGAAGE